MFISLSEHIFVDASDLKSFVTLQKFIMEAAAGSRVFKSTSEKYTSELEIKYLSWPLFTNK